MELHCSSTRTGKLDRIESLEPKMTPIIAHNALTLYPVVGRATRRPTRGKYFLSPKREKGKVGDGKEGTGFWHKLHLWGSTPPTLPPTYIFQGGQEASVLRGHVRG